MKLIVKECENEKGQYYTLINPKTKTHCHALDLKTVNNIQNCYNSIASGKPVNRFGYSIRNKTMKLFMKG